MAGAEQVGFQPPGHVAAILDRYFDVLELSQPGQNLLVASSAGFDGEDGDAFADVVDGDEGV